MGHYTRYLVLRPHSDGRFGVEIAGQSPLTFIAQAAERGADIRYSPILPAFLTPGQAPLQAPQPKSVTFYFCERPYQALGRLRQELNAKQRDAVYFTQGLASIVVTDIDLDRSRELLHYIQSPSFEFWPLENGSVTYSSVVSQVPDPPTVSPTLGLDVTPTGVPELDVYREQITASLATLWHFYGRYYPQERQTLHVLTKVLRRLTEAYQSPGGADAGTVVQRQNAIVSALVELSAALSYSVTQGTTGAVPILGSRPPFPHHSLLGVGGAIRALTCFTRYLEYAFYRRSAADVIKREFPLRRMTVSRISRYDSGEPYRSNTDPEREDDFDRGGDCPENEGVPLLTQFSLRHGFKESKFSVTAASESLTAETLPQWTLMTLSHEVMHSRVRDIFQALFGTTWEAQAPFEAWNQYYREFADWYMANDPSGELAMDVGSRILVLNFCCAVARYGQPMDVRRDKQDRAIESSQLLFECYRKHKMLAIELYVHFHDYHFAFANQYRLYVMSIWASWTKVAAPYLRLNEYIVRTLATIAAGTGLQPRAAFEDAIDRFTESLDALEVGGIRSSLVDQARAIMATDREKVFALFKPAYYLSDHVRRSFASRVITRSIDRLESDPFSEGSADVETYSANVYTFGEPSAVVSPIRFCLATLVGELSGNPAIDDLQWLTAWNSMVIASQETRS